MPYFSEASKARLKTCHKDLQELFNEVIKHHDCTILEGHRDREAQNTAYINGRSKLKYPFSKHNTYPSDAVDVAPYPIDWEDLERFRRFAWFVRGVAAARGIEIRCGADWDGDHDIKDQTFHDLPHFELIHHGGTY